MQSDAITRLLLAGILIGQAVLILQNMRSGPEPPAPAASTGPAPTRAALAPLPPRAEREGFRNRRGKTLSEADIVAMVQAVENGSLPADMRVWAALQLEGIHVEHALDALIGVLNDPEEALSTAALQALAGIEDPRVLAAARRAQSHEDDGVRAVAAYVLKSLGESPGPGGAEP